MSSRSSSSSGSSSPAVLASSSAFFFFGIIFIINVIQVFIIFRFIITSSLSFLFGLLLLFFVLFILHGLFGVLGGPPGLITNPLSLLNIIRDQNVVKNRTRLDLPQVETNLANFVVFAEILGVVRVVVGVLDLGVDPLALVLGVVDLAGFPFALVVGVVDHGGFPFAVHFVIPIFGF